MADRFSARVAVGPMLLDAALGTRLIAAGLDLAGDDPCLWNIAHPDRVADLHRADVAAGSEAVFANTFGANRAWLARFGRAGDVGPINLAAVGLARAAVGPAGFVVGSIGPTAADDPAALVEQAAALRDAGADALALETFRDAAAVAALGHLAPVVDVPILVGLYDWPGPIGPTVDRLLAAGAALVGANCCANFGLATRLVEACAARADAPFWLKPATAGPGGARMDEADFVALAGRLAAAGRGLLGGCCGTTDEHVRAIRAAWAGAAGNRGNVLARRTRSC